VLQGGFKQIRSPRATANLLKHCVKNFWQLIPANFALIDECLQQEQHNQ
jgi:hypothetical protein